MRSAAENTQPGPMDPQQAAAGQPAASALGALRTVEFRLGLKGYNVDEVDQYLEQVATEADVLVARCQALESENQQLGARVAELESGSLATGEPDSPASVVGEEEGEEQESAEDAPEVPRPESLVPATPAPAAPAVSDEALQRTLLLAQQFVDETKRRSEQEASELVAGARAEADQLLASARAESESLQAEVSRRRQAELGDLEADRARLVAARDQLAARLEADRHQVRERLVQVLAYVDEAVQLGAGPVRSAAPAVADAGSEGAERATSPALGEETPTAQPSEGLGGPSGWPGS